MRILFIVPPMTLEKRYGKLKDVGTLYPSLGLAYLGAVAEKLGNEVKVMECEAMGYGYDEIRDFIEKYEPELVGMQTFYNTLDICLKVASLVKEINKEIKVLLGGVQVTIFPEEGFDENVDYLIIGEGEITFKEFLENFNKKELGKIKGLVWKKNGKFVMNEARELIKNLDEIPMPAFHLFPMEKYHSSAQLRGNKTFHLMTSRGCPYRCVYCASHQTFGKSHRFHSAKRVVEEIRYLMEKYKCDSIQFYDETFTLNKKRVIELCDEMSKEKINIPWACFTRVHLVDEEMLRKMKQAGCYQIFYGVEAGTQRLLNLIKKDITIEQIKDAFKLTRKIGIEALASFMLALPTETREDAEASIKLAIEIDADYAQWQNTIPYPGNELYELALKHGKIAKVDKEDFTPWNKVVYVPYGRTEKDIQEMMSKAYRKFYLRPRQILKQADMIRKLPAMKIFNLVKSSFGVFFGK